MHLPRSAPPLRLAIWPQGASAGCRFAEPARRHHKLPSTGAHSSPGSSIVHQWANTLQNRFPEIVSLSSCSSQTCHFLGYSCFVANSSRAAPTTGCSRTNAGRWSAAYLIQWSASECLHPVTTNVREIPARWGPSSYKLLQKTEIPRTM